VMKDLKKEIKNIKPKSKVLVPAEQKFEKKNVPYSFMDHLLESKGVKN